MSRTDAKLLGNLPDTLDRVFDRECSDVDLWALLVATGIALRRHGAWPDGRTTRVRRAGDPCSVSEHGLHTGRHGLLG